MINNPDYECPDCGGRMVRRVNKRTQEPFWGCELYPECTGTRPTGGGGEDRLQELPSDRGRRNDSRRWERE